MMRRFFVFIFTKALAALRFETAERLGGALGILAYYLGVRRKVVADQMRICLPHLSVRQRRMAAKRCYASIGANAFSIFATNDDKIFHTKVWFCWWITYFGIYCW